MAPPASKLSISHDGLINDVEQAMEDLIDDGFSGGDEFLTNLLDKPTYFEKENPDNTTIDDVPAMFCWVDGISLDQAGLGGQSGNKQRNTFDLIGNYAYITRLSDEQSSKEMKKIGWWLLYWIMRNMDLLDSISGNPEVGDLIIQEKWSMMGGQLKTLTSLQIQVSYPFTMKEIVANKSKAESKYTRG